MIDIAQRVDVYVNRKYMIDYDIHNRHVGM